ncbi:hypothetical protein NKR23_g12455 [Pleurostoma richardsiae]|uniref:BHLH domain-containing protein n=1 Tax=Pleurostoma richardsiae TaxID=41990 RepID=A0AA38RG03_9PEZI|nr:hypothetical protein NKR23_g12455 [Pleurostoma richardsiae]
MSDRQNSFADESSEMTQISPLNLAFTTSMDTGFSTSAWADHVHPVTDGRAYQPEDQYHPGLKSDDYFWHPSAASQSYPTSDDRGNVRSSTFSTSDCTSENFQGFWPRGDASSSSGVRSASTLTFSAGSLAIPETVTESDFSGIFYVAPSLLNAETDQDSVWPGSATFGTCGTPTGSDCFHAEANPAGGEEAVEVGAETFGPPPKKQRHKDAAEGNAQIPDKKHARSQSMNSALRSSESASSKSKGPATAAPTPNSRFKSAGQASMPMPAIQLRTASRKAKRVSASYRPATSPEEARARSGHNQVEKQYRNRLNQHFERLLAVLPAKADVDGDQQDDILSAGGLDPDKRLSKADVLDIARRHIRTLERQTSELGVERQQLVDEIGRMTETAEYPNRDYTSDSSNRNVRR